MKYFNLTCPHCEQVAWLPAGQVREWYAEHVTHCAVRPGGHEGRRAAAIEAMVALARLAGLKIADVKERIKLVGRVLIERCGRDGDLLEVRLGFNLIVDAGRAYVIDRLQASPPAVADYQAIGTGTNSPAAGDTTLQTENARVQGTTSQPNATTDRLVTTFAAGTGTGAITETGRLNASSGGTLYCRQTFSVVNKGASDSLQVTHDVTD